MSGASRAAALPPTRAVPIAGRRWLTLAAPVALFALAAAVNLGAAALVSFPASEGSAYYVAVARNLVEGRGLVIDAVWSYATPPLVLPRPAFELWQPLASIVAAGPMALLGTSFTSAQLGGALLGASLAPLAWLVARDATGALDISDQRRVGMLAAGSGIVLAVSGPLLAAVALPDSTIPFAVTGVVVALLLARVVRSERADLARAGFLLGLALGVCWLARHEALWLGLTALVLAAVAHRLDRRLLGGLAIGGLLATGPWLVRNFVTFGTPLPGQTIENALLTANEQIFAYAARPSLDAFLAQGVDGIAAHIAAGTLHNVVLVLLVPAAPVAVAGLLSALWLWRRPALRTTALGALLLSGALTLAVASVVFPVASLWGTFQHAAGPLLVGLAVAAVIGLDQLVAAIGRRRGWQRGNAWLAPFALFVLSVPLSAWLVFGLAEEARDQSARIEALSAVALAQPEAAPTNPPPAASRPVLIADHPIWLSDATGLPAIALPAEPLDSVLGLARQFDAALVVIVEPRGEYPALLFSAEASRCFFELTPDGSGGGLGPARGLPTGAAIFAIAEGCR